jgi:hypothetical protein
LSIASSDLLIKLSVKTGAAGNSTAGTPAGSLGKYISTTEIVDATLANLFDAISGDENAASTVEYRCLFVHNAHGTLTLTSPVVWLYSETAGGASAAIAVDTTAASAIGASAAQALQVADELTAPSGLSFTAPTSKGTGLAVGDIPAGECKAVWVRRTAANTAALDVDGVVLRVEGDTSA